MVDWRHWSLPISRSWTSMRDRSQLDARARIAELGRASYPIALRAGRPPLLAQLFTGPVFALSVPMRSTRCRGGRATVGASNSHSQLESPCEGTRQPPERAIKIVRYWRSHIDLYSLLSTSKAHQSRDRRQPQQARVALTGRLGPGATSER